jgi:hypothetical protein
MDYVARTTSIEKIFQRLGIGKDFHVSFFYSLTPFSFSSIFLRYRRKKESQGA